MFPKFLRLIVKRFLALAISLVDSVNCKQRFIHQSWQKTPAKPIRKINIKCQIKIGIRHVENFCEKESDSRGCFHSTK